MLTKRDYKLTPETRDWGVTWKVEVWNDFGMKRTIYSEDVISASEYVMDWWENSEKEFDKMNIQSRTINNLVKKDLP
jgi:hypothetical protein